VDRLFIRIQLHILASLLLGGILCGIFVAPRINERVRLNMEESGSVPVAIMAQVIADSRMSQRELYASLERASARFHVPVTFIDRGDADLDEQQFAQLDRGEVLRLGGTFRPNIFVRINGTNAFVRFGPLQVAPPLSGGRGVAILVVVLAALSLGIYWFLRPIRQRLAELGQTAAALGRGDLGARATVGPSDAIGALASTFNRMADEIERLIAAQEELLRMTSHELRTPIQRLHFAIESVRDAHDATARERGLCLIDRDLEELDQLIEELLTYVRLKDHRAPVRTSIELCTILEELIEVVSELKGDITLTFRGPAEGSFLVDVEARLLRRAVSNLLVNALRHARSRVDVTVGREGRMIRICVDDDGPGIPIADRERIFEPFQRLDDERTKSSRGFGLGLAIVRRIAEIHGGSVAVLTSEWGGARLRLSIPQKA
jgi:signal transduction histidine kinase